MSEDVLYLQNYLRRPELFSAMIPGGHRPLVSDFPLFLSCRFKNLKKKRAEEAVIVTDFCKNVINGVYTV